MRLILFVFLLITSNVFSQDTIRVYFDFGSSKPNFIGETELSTLSIDYDLDGLLSIQFIGFADSVGNMNSNLRLSRKRAKNAYKLTKKVLDKNLEYSILARGEGVNENPALNRRVEIILHYIQEEIDVPTEEIVDVDPKCFFIDFEALALCNVRTITKKRKRYALIEAMNVSHFKDSKHYYVKKDLKGNVTVRRLKWKKKKTGILWWKRVRYVAEMPKKSFDKYQFFTLEDSPCDGCPESIFTKDTIIKEITKSYPDIFLMSNMQTRVKLFGKQKLKIRVPKEYIDFTEKYYTFTDPYKKIGTQLISWKTKKGKRRQNYLYTRVHMPDHHYPIIMKNRTTIMCLNKWEGIYGDPNRFRVDCATNMRGGGIRGDFALDVGVGTFYQNDTITGFLSLGVSYRNHGSDIEAKIGINTHLGLYFSGSYDYHFYQFPFTAINPLKQWKSVGFSNPILVFGSFYGGLEMKSVHKKDYHSFFETNAHIGVSLTKRESSSFMSEFYVQPGVGWDVLNRVNNQFYPFVEVGVVFHLF